MALMHLFIFRPIMASYLALLFWKMLPFVSLPAILGTSHCLMFVPVINTALLLRAPMLPTRWANISTYLQSEPFLSISCILINLKLLILSVQNPNILCYVILITFQFRLIVCLLFFVNVFFQVFSCNLSLTLCCVCP
jgi:hypothetical protein